MEPDAHSVPLPELGAWDWEVESQQLSVIAPPTSWITSGETSRSTWASLVHPEDLPGVLQDLQAYVDGRSSGYRREYRARGPDGDWRWVLGWGSAVARDEQGRPTRVAGLHIDIHARKAGEIGLTRHLRFVDASRRIAEAIIGGDSQQAILDETARLVGEALEVDRTAIYEVSHEKGQIFGISVWQGAAAAHLPGRGAPPPFKLPAAIQKVLRTRAGFESHVGDVDEALAQDGVAGKIHQDSGIRSLLVQPFSFMDDGFFVMTFARIREERRFDPGELEFVRGVVSYLSVALLKLRLLSDRERALEALRKSEERYRALYDNTPSMFFTVDSQGFVCSMNHFVVEHLGWTEDELLGRRLHTIIHQEDRDALHRQLEAAFRTPERVHHWQLRKLKKDGTTAWVRETARVSPTSSGAMALIVCDDITEQRRTEEAMFQAQKLEGLGVLAGGIAHDFNNLLVGIVGNAELAKAGLDPDSRPRRQVEQIILAGRRAAALAGQLLAYAGKGQVLIQRLDLNAMIEELGELLRVSISPDVLLSFDLDPGAPKVEGDATQLRQVVMNLVVNGSEAMEGQRGLVRIATHAVKLDSTQARQRYTGWGINGGDYVALEVSDSGTGMSEETQRRIFDPFFSTKPGGRGLGLAAVQGIVRAHHGALRVWSQPGGGSSFEVVLPRFTGAAPRLPSRTGDFNRLPPDRRAVLIVDDDPMVRAVTRAMIGQVGLEALEASDGIEARAILDERGSQVGCILLDLTMPHGGGEAVLSELRELRPEVPVVLMSGYGESDVANLRQEPQVTGFLQKPFTIDDLSARLATALGS